MIKLLSLVEQFTPNSNETPEISYGNEKRITSMLPSLQMQDVSEEVFGQPSQDHEATMAKGELKSLISNSSKIYNIIEEGTELPGWVSAYITLASDYMNSVAQYVSEVSSN
jgi:hypothetical protein